MGTLAEDPEGDLSADGDVSYLEEVRAIIEGQRGSVPLLACPAVQRAAVRPPIASSSPERKDSDFEASTS
jgi:hypothetical protein